MIVIILLLTSLQVNSQKMTKAIKTISIPINNMTLTNNKSALNKLSQVTTIELNNKLEAIKVSINQLKKSSDESTVFSIVGLVSGLLAITISVIIPYLYEKAKKPNLLVQTAEASMPFRKISSLQSSKYASSTWVCASEWVCTVACD